MSCSRIPGMPQSMGHKELDMTDSTEDSLIPSGKRQVIFKKNN